MSLFRIEHDLLGEAEIPKEAFWGIHTLRAIENYPITGKTIGTYTSLVRALALVKQAAAEANAAIGHLPKDKAEAIVGACCDILDGQLHDQFVVDVIQGGAGTSTNMNANEVIANRALERMGFNGKDSIGFSAHGFRATASTILNELNFRPDVIERQLAHAERNKVRASYNQGEYLEERRAMMQQWADLTDEMAKSESKVAPINSKAA